MRDISLHLLDIVQNSIRAQAKLVKIKLSIDNQHMLTLVIDDDGSGMDAELTSNVQKPFTTTRSQRKIGLGLPLLTESAQRTGGYVSIDSLPGKGTVVKAIFHMDHIDCLPIGDITGTLLSLVVACPLTPDLDFVLEALGKAATLNTCNVKAALNGVPINEPEVIAWMKSSLEEEIQQVFGGTEYEIHR